MPFFTKRSDNAHPPRDAANRDAFDAARGEPEQLASAGTARHRAAQGLLVELYAATRELGDALTRAGFDSGRWGTSEARLSTLDDRLPAVTLAALLARLADFARVRGPHWLAGTDATGATGATGTAVDEFAHEVQVLAAAVGPVDAFAGRARTIASAATGGRSGRGSLEHILRDGRVRRQLERLSDALRQLRALAPMLEPLSPPSGPSMSAQAGAVGAVWSAGVLPSEQSSEQWGAPAAPGWLLGHTAQEQASDAQPGASKRAWQRTSWLGSRLLHAVWARRRTRAALGGGLATLLLVLALTGTFAVLHGLPASNPEPSVLGRAVGTATAIHSRGATPSVVRTSTAGAPTQAPAAPSTTLVVRPGSIVLPCTGTNVTLTVSNTGQQALNWQASVSGSASLSDTSGTVSPTGQATLSVHATGTQHGPGTITFTSNGGTAKVAFKVSCH